MYSTRYPAVSMPPAPDVGFYRILCITLVTVAVTFTVILTSIFVDIDGLLARQSSQAVKKEPTIDFKPVPLEEYQSFPSNEDNDDEMESSFRSKRSLESNNLVYNIKSPKLKKILTNHLATLLEELDEDESSHATEINNNIPVTSNSNNAIKSNYINGEEKVPKNDNKNNVKDDNENFKRTDKNTDVLHVAMHNILLQGIIGHMDLSEVYKKVHQLIKKLGGTNEYSSNEFKNTNFRDKSTELMKIISRNSFNEEDTFFEELLKCQKLQEQISQIKHVTDDEQKKATDSPILIKAVIEVTDNEKMKENIANASKQVKGLIKMLYNGKPTEIEEMVDNKNDQMKTIQRRKINEKHNLDDSQSYINQNENNKKTVFDHAINEYFKAHSIQMQNQNHLTKESFATKRLKRQIKIRYENDKDTSEKSKKLNKNQKHHNDELYVEIETHFDGRGSKGEKKKKLVRSLIDKIQKAINSNIEDAEKDGTEKPLLIKKRTQNPIDNKEQVANNLHVKTVEQRLLNPITKTVNMIQPLKSVLGKYGEEWKKIYNGPGFLTVAKSLNSAEMNELDIDYNSVMDNGIPKRLQMPLNTENGDINKTNEPNNKNVTLYLKEIDGSGFTIGINQYADEPPDQASLQMFTGLENLIKAYHERYDQEDTVSDRFSDRTDSMDDNNQDIIKEHAHRQKRSALRMKLFSNLKSKTNLNKFLNTNPMQKKKIFLKSKRNKRHIDKIRIVASDHYPRQENENIFLVSHEDIFADRAIVRKQDMPEVEIGDKDDEHYDYIAPYENPYNIPHLQPYMSSTYDAKTLQTRLMSHYPHMFVENISKSKEEYLNVNPTNHKIFENNFRKVDLDTPIDATGDARNEKNTSLPSVEEIINAILPRTNYKLTVKILPKNKSEINPGYKEVHTTINKSYDKNGLRYVSSVNVSEISKYENFNKSNEEIGSSKNTEKGSLVNDEIEKERNKIKLLLKLHKAGIDRQLEYLKMESQKIKGMIGKEDRDNMLKNMSHVVDVFRQLGLIDLGTIGIVNEYKPNLNETTTQKTLTNNSGTTVHPNPFSIEKMENDLIKAELMNTIKQNENNTRQLLQKIDNNTNVLQSFLQKLVDKLHSTQVNMEAEKLLRKNSLSQKHSKAIIPFIDDSNGNFSKPIPFIYAFQHPIVQNKDKPFKSVANVVYHGHIHANEDDKFGKRGDFFKDVASNIKFKNSESQKENNNETRFFIDDLENDFKFPSNDNREPITNIGNNTKSN